MSIPTNIRQAISTQMAWKYRIIPYQFTSDTISLYVDENINNKSIKIELEVLLGKELIYEQKDKNSIDALLNRYYPQGANVGKQSSVIIGQENFVELLIKESKQLGGSDIHLEPYEKGCRVRIRIDGLLVERYTITKQEYPAIVNKLKIMSRLDISEKRLPQDGRIGFNQKGEKFDIRVSILPTLNGEKLVLRILNNNADHLSIENLGFTSEELILYKDSIKKPNGIILISGPTGSGKTTTLYATLKELNKSTRNIVTIEDPIEYTLEGVNQVQLKESIGLGFASTLRTFLRQDPDIIMVGEIRDVETAQMAIRASLTGHLVLSTIHTNSAWGIIDRLIDMGIPSYMVANTMNMAVAQRLVRLLCPVCKKAVDLNHDLIPAGLKNRKLPRMHHVSVGCRSCYYTGYKGRKAIYELLSVNENLKDGIKQNNFNIQNYIETSNVKLLSDQALKLITSGKTSLEEVYSLLF
jgi:general secretion pathway protein E/type IV pilus assembly protein PilB